MNPKSTFILLGSCLLLFGLIVFLERPLRRAASIRPAPQLFPGFKPAAVTQLQIRPAGRLDIRLDRTNGAWRMTQPLEYPADTVKIEKLLQVLTELNWIAHISAEELRERPNAQEEFGFSSPQLSLIAQEGGYRRHLLVGKKTALGDQVYVQIVGGEGFFLADSTFLKYLPREANELRDATLFDVKKNPFETVKVRSGTKGFDLHYASSNRLWHLVWPLSARADNAKVNQLLARLFSSQVVEFVSDAPDAELDRYGLQSPELEISFLNGTNEVSGLQIGKASGSSFAYVRRAQEPGIFLVAREPLDPWRAVYTDFREKRLLSLLPEELEGIEVQGDDTFTLRRLPDARWEIAGKTNSPADAGLMRDFLLTLTRIQTELEKTVVTDFSVYGLTPPLLRYGVTRTGAVENARIDFGTNDGRVFARRTDETFVNAIKTEDFQRLPRASWQFRERRIWDFDSTNVLSVTVRQKGKTRTLVRNKKFEWTFAADSQGVINTFSLEETLHRLGELQAVYWVARDEGERFGFSQVDHQISLRIKKNDQVENLSIAFGQLAASQNPYARVMIDQQPVIFEFPWPLYYDPIRRDLMISEDFPRQIVR